MPGAKRSKEDETLDALRALRGAGLDADGRALVRKALGAKRARIVAAAAELTAEHDLRELVPLFAPIFTDFTADAVKRDPGCLAKRAIVEALVQLERDPDELLLRAVRYRQLEPAFGPPVDTAVTMRAQAARGLANMGHPEAPSELARLLADKEWAARAGAAHAIGGLARTTCVPLLRYKALAGDAEPAVIGECFRALLAADPGPSLDFVAEHLGADEAVAEQAALALGESRSEAAFDRLVAWRDTLVIGPSIRVALVAIGLLRTDRARDYLMAILRDGDRRSAAHAAEALAIYRHDPKIREQVLAAVRARGDKGLREEIERSFRA